MYRHKLDLSGRVAIFTGAGRNIGYACTGGLSEADAHVVLTDLDEQLSQSAESKASAPTYFARDMTKTSIERTGNIVVADAGYTSW